MLEIGQLCELVRCIKSGPAIEPAMFAGLFGTTIRLAT